MLYFVNHIVLFGQIYSKGVLFKMMKYTIIQKFAVSIIFNILKEVSYAQQGCIGSKTQ